MNRRDMTRDCLVLALGMATLLVGLLWASTAHAEDKPSLKLHTLSWAVLAGGQAADVVTTWRDLPMGGGRCVEGNAGVYGSNPDLKRLVLGKVLIAAPVAAVTLWADHVGSHKVANVTRAVFGAFGGGAAIWNLHEACR